MSVRESAQEQFQLRSYSGAASQSKESRLNRQDRCFHPLCPAKLSLATNYGKTFLCVVLFSPGKPPAFCMIDR